jgi:hypothetical protein
MINFEPLDSKKAGGTAMEYFLETGKKARTGSQGKYKTVR